MGRLSTVHRHGELIDHGTSEHIRPFVSDRAGYLILPEPEYTTCLCGTCRGPRAMVGPMTTRGAKLVCGHVGQQGDVCAPLL